MKRFVRVICIVGFALLAVSGAGTFSNASADRDGYYNSHRDHHHRYRHAYNHCANRYRVGGHRFERCMSYQLEEYRRW